METIPQTNYEKELDPKDGTSFLMRWQSSDERDRALRTFGRLPPTKRLEITWPKGERGFETLFRVVDVAAADAVTVRKEGEPALPPAPPAPPDEVLSRARAMETWKRADLETRAAEVGVKCKGVKTSDLAAAVAAAEHKSTTAKP